ncbi:radical SAM protein [bacterium]|nr:radical SAM protein [bacterium]
MTNTIYQTPVCKMKIFKNLFIELSAKNCNMHCKHCYIDFPSTKNIKDFININYLRENLAYLKKQNPECIYLTGAEPMTHPDFNTILRMCLKITNVCIITNGSFINEKKARFLKKVQNESSNEIITELSFAHFDELKNDEVRSRGSFRISLNAIKNLVKYGFSPIILFTNFYNENPNLIYENLKKLCQKVNYEIDEEYIKINNYTDENQNDEEQISNWTQLDCEYGRTLTANGVYVCPFLSNDYRGRSGATLADFSQKNTLETNFCADCAKNCEMYYGIDFSKF